jgi:hypothetical protein
MKNVLSAFFILILLNGCEEKKTQSVPLSESQAINNSIIEYDNRVGELCNYGEEMEKLTEAQKVFYLNQNLEREVNNGGFHQYFYNSSGNFAHETVDALKKIGADKTASILQNSIEKFPDKNVPKDRDERISLLGQIEKSLENIWADNDEAFFKCEDDLNALNLAFIEKNKKDFDNLK